MYHAEQKDGRKVGTDAAQIEEICYRYMVVGGGLIAVGLGLMLTAVLFWLGAPLAALGAALVGGNIVWSLKLRKRAGIVVTCPHCSREYTILPGSHSFMCDECRRSVPVPRAA